MLSLWMSLCTSPFFPLRTGHEKCWVKFTLAENRTLCLSHETWHHTLTSPILNPICADPKGQWKATSPPENSLESPRLSSEKRLKKIKYTQTVRQLVVPLTINHSLVARVLSSLERLRERTSRLLSPFDRLGILRHLILNEGFSRNHSRQDPSGILRHLGFVHLITASGIHLYALATWWTWLVRQFCPFFSISVRTGFWAGRFTSLLLCFTIWVLGGSRLGMLRPGVILLLRESSQLLGMRWRRVSPLFLALGIDLGMALVRSFQSPGSLQRFGSVWENSGRWTYALAVGGGILGHEAFSKQRGWMGHLGLALGSWIFVALWEIHQTGLVALATPILSLVTLPLICLGIYPLLVLSIFLNELSFYEPAIASLAPHLIRALAEGTYWSLFFLAQFALLPWNLWIVLRGKFPLAAFFSTLMTYIDFRYRRRAYGLPLAAISVFSLVLAFGPVSTLAFRFKNISFQKPNRIPQTASFVEQLDVGQGDSAIIGAEGLTGFVDTGSEKALSDSQWLELLSQRGIQQLDWVALTHLDEDHSGGLIRLARLLPIGCVVTPGNELRFPRGKTMQKSLETSNVSLQDWNQPCIPYSRFLVQTEKFNLRSSGNENMGIVLVPLREGGFYLSAGDLNAQKESSILPWVKQVLDSGSGEKTGPRILKISHHGSRYSTTPELLRTIRPTEAWISVGVGNRYGHPTQKVLRELGKLKIPTRRTDLEGNLRTPLQLRSQ